jgi:hypothetical protein
MHTALMTPQLPQLLSQLILIRPSRGSSATPLGGTPANWNQRTRQRVDLCCTRCCRSLPLEIRDASANVVYAIGRSLELTAPLHISDTSTSTTVPFGVKVLVGQWDGAKLPYISFLYVPDTLQSATLSLAREFDPPC